MLRRTELRRYLIALLSAETVPQTCDCRKGPLWENCGCAVRIDDSLGEATSEDTAEGRAPVSIVVTVENDTLTLATRAACATRLNAVIEIIACGGLGVERANILDEIHERILHRFYAAPRITDPAGQVYRSPLRMARGGTEVTISATDDPEYDESTTSRTLQISVIADECVSAPDCPAPEVCFNFDALLIPPKTDSGPPPATADPAPSAEPKET